MSPQNCFYPIKNQRGFKSREGFYSTRGLHFYPLTQKADANAFFALLLLIFGGILFGGICDDENFTIKTLIYTG